MFLKTPLNLLSFICQNVPKFDGRHFCPSQNVPKFDGRHFCPMRGVPQTPTLRIPLKLQPKPRVLGFFDMFL